MNINYPQSIHRRLRVKFKRGDLVTPAPGYRRMMGIDFHNKVGIVIQVYPALAGSRTPDDCNRVRWFFDANTHPIRTVVTRGLSILKKAQDE